MHTKAFVGRWLGALALVVASCGAARAQAYEPALDPTVDACDDFYLRACGGFIRSARPDAAHPSLSLTDQLFDANLERSFAALFAQGADKDPGLKRLASFYFSCLAGCVGVAVLV